MTSEFVIACEDFASASEFLGALCDADQWTPTGAWYSPWVFRGQRDSSWHLTPSAWRQSSTPALERMSALKARLRDSHRDKVLAGIAAGAQAQATTVGNILEAYVQGRAEFRLVLEFVEMADRLGHPVPGMQRYMSLRDYDWLPEPQNHSMYRFVIEPNPATTLAQHHGIPTRFLDWTQSAATASFFAASEIDPSNEQGSIAVWAIRPDLLVRYGESAAAGDEGVRYLSYEAPRADNLYLQAQDGLFLYPAAACTYYSTHGSWPSLEQFALAAQRVAGEPVIKKLTLRNSEVGKLLRLLWLAGVSKAHLMPTYDNITAALVTKWRWHP